MMIFLVFFNARPLSSSVLTGYTKGIRDARTDYGCHSFNASRQIGKEEGFGKHVIPYTLRRRTGISQFIS
jgi:hypothetical protein